LQAYPFVEISMACSDAARMETSWCDMFEAEVIFRGNMIGLPFTRLLACGITLVFREYSEFQPPRGLAKSSCSANTSGCG
jgi:hypothetical protein